MNEVGAARSGRGRAGASALITAIVLFACAPAYDPETLFRDLQSPDVEARQEATQTLDALVRAGDYKVFVRALQSPEPLYRAQAIVYLSSMTRPGARQALRDLLRLERRMLLPYNPIRVRPTNEMNDSRILVAHLIAVGGGDAEAADALLAGVGQDQAPDVLKDTCLAAGALGDPKGIAFLAGLSRSPALEVARAAVQALGSFKQPEALAALRGLLSHPAIEVRGDLLTSVRGREEPEAIDLLKEMGTSDPSPDLRASAIRVLLLREDPALAPYFIERLHAKEPEVQAAAREALGRIARRDLGARPAAWAKWWAENRGRLSATR